MVALPGAAPSAHAASAPADFAGLGDWAWPTTAVSKQEGSEGLKHWRVGLVWDWVERTQGKQGWGGYDNLLRDAATNGYDMTFAINGCTTWACGATRTAPQTPSARAAFLNFISTAVKRYGAGGEFWAKNPQLSRVNVAWQVWNEVNVGEDWPKPTAAAYQSLLSDTNATIKGIDPSATVVTSGLAEFPANTDGATLGTFLTGLEADPAFRTSADVVALHGYASDPAGTARILDSARAIMRANGDNRPIWITELGWASAGPAHPFVSDPNTQAAYIREAYDTMVACKDRWGLQRAMWFGLKDVTPASIGASDDSWNMHLGLYNLDGSAKPALDAFREYLGGRELPNGRASSCTLPGGNDPAAPGTVELPRPKTGTGSGPTPIVTITRAPTMVGSATKAPRVDFVTDMGNAGNVECSIDGGAWALCQTPFMISKDREGQHTLQVRAISPTKVTGPIATTSWVVDVTAPSTVIKKAPKKVKKTAKAALSFGVAEARLASAASVSDSGIRFQCKLNKAGWKTCPANYKVRIAKPGKQVMKVRAVDAAGNVDPRGATARFTVTKR